MRVLKQSKGLTIARRSLLRLRFQTLLPPRPKVSVSWQLLLYFCHHLSILSLTLIRHKFCREFALKLFNLGMVGIKLRFRKIKFKKQFILFGQRKFLGVRVQQTTKNRDGKEKTEQLKSVTRKAPHLKFTSFFAFFS